MDDDQPEILSADDICPFCRAVMTDRGEYGGIWDGALGQGSGNWYTAHCPKCDANLIGWEYGTDAAPDESHVRWEGRRHRASDAS
jgi:hypothetical protein